MKIVVKDNRRIPNENKFAEALIAEHVTAKFAYVFRNATNDMYRQNATDKWYKACVEEDDYTVKRDGVDVTFPPEWLM